MKNEFLMLAHKYDEKKHFVNGWFMSEKLDGMRCMWDGGISRGKPKTDIPWANTTKDSRYVIVPECTGLWSRYGHPIQAPDWFLSKLPAYPLDGELWTGREGFQDVMKIVKKLNPVDSDWTNVTYMVFDSPTPQILFGSREIKNTNFRKLIPENPFSIMVSPIEGVSFASRLGSLRSHSAMWKQNILCLHHQVRLSEGSKDCKAEINEALDSISELNGEGLMLRDSNSVWVPYRSHALVKVKPLNDAEATILGYTWAKEVKAENRVDLDTSRPSKLHGMMGTLIVVSNGVQFEIGTGFTEAEREMTNSGNYVPGAIVCVDSQNMALRRGETITFKYASLTEDGVPREARYWRKHV